MPPSGDPYFQVKQELQEEVNGVQAAFSRWQALRAGNAERMSLARTIENGHDSVVWQLRELSRAVNKAYEDPQRFNLTHDELRSRSDWILHTQQQMDSIMASMRGANAAASALAGVTSPFEQEGFASNDDFLRGQGMVQQEVLREQDQHLDRMDQALGVIQEQGRTMNAELQEQSVLIDDLESGVESTQFRLKTAHRKVHDVINRMSMRMQFCILLVLIVAIVLLLVYVFY